MFFDWQLFFVERYVALVVSSGNMDLKDWAAVCTISWILYQLIERRRISEANVDKFLEGHFTDKSRSIDEQRRSYLAHLSSATSSWPIARLARFCFSNVVRALWFIWRVVKLDFGHASARHALLLFDSGSEQPAQKEFLRVADNLMETARTYRKQASLKRNEAINAYIFAGRVAKNRRG